MDPCVLAKKSRDVWHHYAGRMARGFRTCDGLRKAHDGDRLISEVFLVSEIMLASV